MNGEHDEDGTQRQDRAGDGVAATGASNSNQISTSFFPPPPQVYKKFTKRNLRYLEVLNSHKLADNEPSWYQLTTAQRIERQNDILRRHASSSRSTAQQQDEDVDMNPIEDDTGATTADELPEFDLKAELEPPNVDWIEEDGGYTVFGQLWPIPDVTPTLEQLGIPVLYPLEGTNRKELLLTLLQTLLQTYREITADLLKPAQPYDVWVPAVPDPNLSPEQQQQQMATNPGFWTQSTEAKDRLKHMQNVVVNMQFLINELRPVQAKETLKLIMQMQLERRQQETRLIRERCASMRSRVQELKSMLAKQKDN
ncbi:related to MED7-member of RNA Polymerase II transcriptional regulation mediator complex [Sporisorium reilianum SRZ2]|uniref:Mediator of RNA polymerase II transcription subunit 7 n=1 Tax=Sporisorium reilianum (strain SRZ2) TaxID=999809 RepID=E6ZRT6_SPORE|nr:related to MED7-member of RNA Polymerase II transcriptional regulation mediator complex [Sporisorium reilianum SRZ2]